MARIVRRLAYVVAGFVVLALALDGVIAAFQPVLGGDARECVIRTVDESGKTYEDRLALIDDGGTLWVQSGHHFRGWYHRLLRNPDVELVRGGEARPYRAVPLDTPETEARVRSLLMQNAGGAFRFYLIRTLLLFADMKPVRLDPREAAPRD